jgi:hypothetical protein
MAICALSLQVRTCTLAMFGLSATPARLRHLTRAAIEVGELGQAPPEVMRFDATSEKARGVDLELADRAWLRPASASRVLAYRSRWHRPRRPKRSRRQPPLGRLVAETPCRALARQRPHPERPRGEPCPRSHLDRSACRATMAGRDRGRELWPIAPATSDADDAQTGWRIGRTVREDDIDGVVLDWKLARHVHPKDHTSHTLHTASTGSKRPSQTDTPRQCVICSPGSRTRS